MLAQQPQRVCLIDSKASGRGAGEDPIVRVEPRVGDLSRLCRRDRVAREIHCGSGYLAMLSLGAERDAAQVWAAALEAGRPTIGVYLGGKSTCCINAYLHRRTCVLRPESTWPEQLNANNYNHFCCMFGVH